MTTGPVRVRQVIGVLVVLLTATLMLLGGAGTASAHAALVSTDPVQNSVVPTAPSVVTLTFSEGMTLTSDSVRVLDPSGKQVDAGDSEHADGKSDTARVTLRTGLTNGTYTVAWRAVSEDSHPVGGAFTFSIGAPSASVVSALAGQGAKADRLISFMYGAGRAVAYAMFALLGGAAAFVLICWPAGAGIWQVQRLLVTGWVGLLISTVAVLLLRGPYEQGGGISRSTNLSLVHVALGERIYIALAARLLLLAVIGVFLALLVGTLGQPSTHEPVQSLPVEDEEGHELRRLEDRSAEQLLRKDRLKLGVAGVVLAIGLSATWVGTDHSSVGLQVWLALPLATLHLLAMATWLGGLVTLAAGLRQGLEPPAVERFSRMAFGSVTVLALTGLYQSWRGLGSWDALVDTEYGRLLLIKIGCVVAMIGVAWISRSRIARLRSAPEAAAVEVEQVAVVQAVAEVEDPVRRAQLARQQAVPAEAGALRAREGTPARVGLRRSVLVESAVAVVVLVVTTMLTSSPPGRVAQAAASVPRSSAAPAASAVPGRTVELKLPYDTGGRTVNARGTATVSVAPAAVGDNTVRLRLVEASGQPADVPEIRLAFTLPSRELGPLPVALKSEGAGRWSGVAQLSLGGDWVVSVTVRSSDIDQATSVQQLKVGDR